MLFGKILLFLLLAAVVAFSVLIRAFRERFPGYDINDWPNLPFWVSALALTLLPKIPLILCFISPAKHWTEPTWDEDEIEDEYETPEEIEEAKRIKARLDKVRFMSQIKSDGDWQQCRPFFVALQRLSRIYIAALAIFVLAVWRFDTKPKESLDDWHPGDQGAAYTIPPRPHKKPAPSSTTTVQPSQGQ